MINNIFIDLHSGNQYVRILSLFGINQLEYITTKLDYTLFYHKEYDTHIPIKHSTSKNRKNILDIFLEDNIESIDCKKHISLPIDIDNANEYLDGIIHNYTNVNPILCYINTDHFPHISYDIDKYNIKIVASMMYPRDDMDVDLMFDCGLSLCYFYYLNLWSLTDFSLLFDNPNPKDKIFCYSKGFYSGARSHRKYWLDRLKSILPNKLIKTSNTLDKPHFKNANLTLASYALASYFDYNDCMFNIIAETDNVYGLNKSYKFTEKTLYSILFANPSFLICRPELINYLNTLKIALLNNEFGFNLNEDFSICFDNFSKFMANSNLEDRIILYRKHKELQKINRALLLNYIETSKNEILEYLLK